MLSPMFWYRCSVYLVLRHSGLLVLGLAPGGSLFSRHAATGSSVVGVGQVLANVVVAEVDALAGVKWLFRFKSALILWVSCPEWMRHRRM